MALVQVGRGERDGIGGCQANERASEKAGRRMRERSRERAREHLRAFERFRGRHFQALQTQPHRRARARGFAAARARANLSRDASGPLGNLLRTHRALVTATVLNSPTLSQESHTVCNSRTAPRSLDGGSRARKPTTTSQRRRKPPASARCHSKPPSRSLARPPPPLLCWCCDIISPPSA